MSFLVFLFFFRVSKVHVRFLFAWIVVLSLQALPGDLSPSRISFFFPCSVGSVKVMRGLCCEDPHIVMVNSPRWALTPSLRISHRCYFLKLVKVMWGLYCLGLPAVIVNTPRWPQFHFPPDISLSPFLSGSGKVTCANVAQGPSSGEHERSVVGRNLKGRYEEELAGWNRFAYKRTEIHGRQ